MWTWRMRFVMRLWHSLMTCRRMSDLCPSHTHTHIHQPAPPKGLGPLTQALPLGLFALQMVLYLTEMVLWFWAWTSGRKKRHTETTPPDLLLWEAALGNQGNSVPQCGGSQKHQRSHLPFLCTCAVCSVAFLAQLLFLCLFGQPFFQTSYVHCIGHQCSQIHTVSNTKKLKYVQLKCRQCT